MKAEWPADKVERRKTEDLVPYAKNARTHSAQQVEQIAASIREWGWTSPVLIDEAGMIIAGHGRIMAAQSLGIEEVPVMVARGWTDEQKRAYVLADNQIAINAGWDADLLAGELIALGDVGFNLDLLGFESIAELTAMKTAGETDPDDVPEAPANPVTRLGDIWTLGNHRIICGDSTDAATVAALMDGKQAAICFTSPPYAQQRDYTKQIDDWDALMNGVFGAALMASDAPILVNLGLVHSAGKVDLYWSRWLDFMTSIGFPLFAWYVWDKGFGLPGDWNGRLAPAHEFIFHFAGETRTKPSKWVEKKPENIGKIKHGTGLRGKDGKTRGVSSPDAGKQKTKIADSVIRVSPHMSRAGDLTHPAMFPVALCEEIYHSFARAGSIVYEPFCGSGTSLIACEKFGALCYAIELSPAYVDIAVKRWEAFTGEQATLTGDDRTFAEIEALRHG